MNNFDELARQARLELEKEAERIADSEATLTAIQSGQSPSTSWDTSSPSAPSRRLFAGVAAAAILIVGAFVAVIAARGEAPEAVVTPPLTTPETTSTTTAISTNAPPTATAETSMPATSLAPSTTVSPSPASATCEAAPLAPPFLVDGTDVGEPIIEALDDGRFLATWGAGQRTRISQAFGTVADRNNFDFYREQGEGETAGRFEMFALPVGDPPLGEINIFLLDTATDCFRNYFIAQRNLEDDADDLIRRWLAAITVDMAPLFIPDEGLGQAPIASIGRIPLSEIALENGEFPHPVALLPDEIIIIEDVPFSDGLTGRAVAVDRQTGEITRTLQIDELVGREQFGVVGSPDGQIIARLQVGDETSNAFASVVFEETSDGRFTVVGQSETSEAIGDGAYRPAPIEVATDGSVEFQRYPAPGRPDAQASGPNQIERTEADGTTITWNIEIENNGATRLRAEPFLDGALMVADDFVPPAGMLVTDIAYLDPVGVRTEAWRVADRWRLVDHDDHTVVFTRSTSEGLEIGRLEIPPLLIPPASSAPAARRVGCPAFELRDLPDGWARNFFEEPWLSTTESAFQMSAPSGGTVRVRLNASNDLDGVARQPFDVDGYPALSTTQDGMEIVEILVGRSEGCERIIVTFESVSASDIAATLDAIRLDDTTLTQVNAGFTTTKLFGRQFLERVDADPFITRVSDVFGPATSDTGWQQIPSAYPCTGSAEYRSIFWGDLRVVFERTGLSERLSAWSVGNQSASILAPADNHRPAATLGLISAEGIGPGADVSVLDQFPLVGASSNGTFNIPGAVGVQVTSADNIITGVSASRLDCQ